MAAVFLHLRGYAAMRVVSVALITVLTLAVSQGAEPKPDTSATGEFFDRLDTNADGKVTLKEAPEQGRMLVEFLLSQSSRKRSDHLDRAEYMRLTHRHMEGIPYDKAVAAAIGAGDVQRAPENSPACAMGLTAEFVFKRLDVNEDKLITVTEFMRSPGMQDMAKAGEVADDDSESD